LKASLLYVGEYYAYYKDPPKGRVPIGAKKVRLRYTEQRKRSNMDNRQTFAAVTVADSGQEILVRARDLVDFWDAYKNEEAILLKEKLEREKVAYRYQVKTMALTSVLTHRLRERNVPLVIVDGYSNYVKVTIDSLFKWLDISEDEVEAAIEKAVAEKFDEV
jgi:hypothetical protein